MRIKNKVSYINNGNEGRPPIKLGVKLTHWIYFLVLLVIVAYFSRSLYISMVTYDGVGQVNVDKTLLSSTYDGKIISLPIVQEERVEKGTLLAVLSPGISCVNKGVPEDKRIAKLEYDIQVKQVKSKLLKHQKAQLKPVEGRMMMRRALELDDRQQKNQSESQALSNDLDFLKQEIRLDRTLLNKLQNNYKNQKVTNSCPNEVIVSPFKATVKRVFLKVSEFSKRGEGVVLIQPENAAVRIEAFLNKKELQYIALKQRVTITFPDGVQSTGAIDEIQSSAYEFAKREWEDYEPVDARIRIHIRPLDQVQENLWRAYDLFRVRVRGEHE